MRTAALAALLASLVSVLASERALAHHTHTRVVVGVGFGYGYPYGRPWGPWSPWYYPPPYYYPPTIIIRPQQPTVYIEQSTPSTEGWWYYCDPSKGYYPYVKECPSGWQRVPPAPPEK
jgi:hypothetical protein